MKRFAREVYGSTAAVLNIETDSEYNDEGGYDPYLASICVYDKHNVELHPDWDHLPEEIWKKLIGTHLTREEWHRLYNHDEDDEFDRIREVFYAYDLPCERGTWMDLQHTDEPSGIYIEDWEKMWQR